jgi:hypothetical protein
MQTKTSTVFKRRPVHVFRERERERERRRVYETAGQVTTETEVTMKGRKAAGETVSLCDSRAEMFNV